MVLKVHEEAIRDLIENIDSYDFPSIITQFRISLRMTQNGTAEMIGITKDRLNKLENGYFRRMPSETEIFLISRTYGIDFSVLYQKAKDHIEKQKHLKKLRFKKVSVLKDDEGKKECI